MQRSFECSTTASAVVKMQLTGHTAAQGASVQCMQAIETERSPGLPSLMVTTRRRLMPQGTSCSFLQAVTQALHSMQRSASQRNFIRAMSRLLCRSDLTQADLGFLHSSCRIVPVSHYRVRTLTQYKGIGALRIPVTQTQPPSLMPRSPASAGLISMNISCCSSASHLLDRVSSPPPSYSTKRPDERISGNCLAIPFSTAAF